MAFIIDKQTLDDLNLLGKFKKNSAFSIFNATRTYKGELLLDSFFRNPLQDEAGIRRRVSVIRYFHEQGKEFPVDAALFDNVEFYFNISASRNLFDSWATMTKYKLKDSFSSDKFYEKICAGISDVATILERTRQFVYGLDPDGSPYAEEISDMRSVFESEHFRELGRLAGGGTLSFRKAVRLDNIIRSLLREPIERVLGYLYEMDVYISVAEVARDRGFAYPEVLPREEHATEIKGLFHPGLERPVANDVSIGSGCNMFFLTGANMAGKSTFMKSYGTAVYLAHMGFPVPAAGMRFSLLDGMFTSINVPDNIALGYSHFYAEVLRVRQAAEHISDGRNMLIIFDELFKGTNVKDAYDATAAISGAFARFDRCQFIISTHILEVAEHLKKTCPNVQFNYLPTVMEGKTARYPYKLEAGISADRHGMMIINNEKIVDIIMSMADQK